MITMKDYLNAIEFKVSGGSDYGWECFGPNARYLDSSDEEGFDSTYSVSAVFDSVDQTIYIVEAWDYTNHREYRWINPDYKQAFIEESRNREIDPNESFDGNKFIDLDVPEDILEKINAIVNNEEYDDRVKVPVDFSDEELLQYMKLAHDLDITFNELVERALREAIDRANSGQLTKEEAQAFIKARQNEDKISI